MKLQKLLCLALALAMVLALAACTEGGYEEALDKTVNGEGGGNGTDGTDGADGSDGETTDYTVFSEGLDDNGGFSDVKALDHVLLPEFEDVVIPAFSKITADRAIADGDFVNIDFVGSVDGVEFDGGSTQNAGYDIVVGYTSFIDDFIEQLLGHTPGENFDIEVTFPDDYGEESLQGKDAVFNITVNYIWDITDESAKAIGFGGKDAMGQYVAYNGLAVEDVVADPAVSVFLTSSTCTEIPDSVLTTVRDHMRTMIEITAGQYGLDADTYVQYLYGAPSMDVYLEIQGQSEAEVCLIFQALAERDGIAVTDADITEAGYDQYVEIYGKPYVAYTILQEKVSTHISDKLTQQTK